VVSPGRIIYVFPSKKGQRTTEYRCRITSFRTSVKNFGKTSIFLENFYLIHNRDEISVRCVIFDCVICKGYAKIRVFKHIVGLKYTGLQYQSSAVSASNSLSSSSIFFKRSFSFFAASFSRALARRSLSSSSRTESFCSPMRS